MPGIDGRVKLYRISQNWQCVNQWCSQDLVSGGAPHNPSPFLPSLSLLPFPPYPPFFRLPFPPSLSLCSALFPALHSPKCSHSLSDLCKWLWFNNGWILYFPGNWTGFIVCKNCDGVSLGARVPWAPPLAVPLVSITYSFPDFKNALVKNSTAQLQQSIEKIIP